MLFGAASPAQLSAYKSAAKEVHMWTRSKRARQSCCGPEGHDARVTLSRRSSRARDGLWLGDLCHRTSPRSRRVTCASIPLEGASPALLEHVSSSPNRASPSESAVPSCGNRRCDLVGLGTAATDISWIHASGRCARTPVSILTSHKGWLVAVASALT